MPIISKKTIWNPETKEFLGRTGRRWAEIGIYYFIYYTALLTFWSAGVCFFYASLSPYQPRIFGKDSILSSPGLAYRPFDSDPDSKDHEVRWTGEYMKSIEDTLMVMRGMIPDKDESPHCYRENKYGLYGKAINAPGLNGSLPCVLLKLNRMYGFVPKGTMILDHKGRDVEVAKVNCKANNANVRIDYTPQQGFLKADFPYNEVHKSPFVFLIIRFGENGEVEKAEIECTMEDENIEVNTKDMDWLGYVKFTAYNPDK